MGCFIIKNNNSDKITKRSILDCLKKLDTTIDNFIKSLMKYIIPRSIAKIIGEVFLAIVIGVAIYLSNQMYDTATRIRIEDEKLENLAVGISQDYMNSLFSIPQVDYISELNGNHVSTYILEDSVILATFDNNLLVSFFIAVTDKDRIIDLASYCNQDGIFLGKSTFYDTSKNPEAEVNIPASGTYLYYCETSSYGRPGNFNSFVYAYTTYGADVSDYTSELISSAGSYLLDMYVGPDADKSTLKTEYEEIRKKAKPNTFGIIMSGYEDEISVIPIDEEWINILGIINQYSSRK